MVRQTALQTGLTSERDFGCYQERREPSGVFRGRVGHPNTPGLLPETAGPRPGSSRTQVLLPQRGQGRNGESPEPQPKSHTWGPGAGGCLPCQLTWPVTQPRRLQGPPLKGTSRFTGVTQAGLHTASGTTDPTSWARVQHLPQLIPPPGAHLRWEVG